MLINQTNQTEQFQLAEALAELFHGKNIRYWVKGDETWFVAKDVVEAAGGKWHSPSFNRDIGGGGATRTPIVDSLGRTQEITIINQKTALKWLTISRLPETDKLADLVWDIMDKVMKGETVNAKASAQPIQLSMQDIGRQEFEKNVATLSSIIEYGWGKGYLQKMVTQAAADTDSKYGTELSRLIPAISAAPGQAEELDITKGEHLLRQVIGSKECSLEQFKDIFSLKSTTPLNETLVSLGYQIPLRSEKKKGLSGHQVASGKERYAIQVPISSGPFKGQYKISAWILNSFSDAEKSKIAHYLRANYDQRMFV